ncbi:MAG: hypothetical protein AUI14_12500 [Actinobacteria bacterium 13_2_20CM_2_71_6]|nr:MAG: hypothetical protein AUI14_12500 [Actinobacteria bacterium 13_2_20CM_2_71_6]
MLETLARNWWVVGIRGAAALIFGLLALIWPAITVLVLVALFGAYALVDGAFALGTAIFGRGATGGSRGWLVVEGIAGIIAGILTIMWPGITALVLLWLIAAWALVTGVLEIVAAVRLRRELRHEWLLALGGALSVLFGIVLIVWPAAGALAVVTLIGIYAIVFGVVLLALAFRLRRLGRGAVAGSQRPATA